MKVIQKFSARPTEDGDGVKIRRIADFMSLTYDPFLMIDELKSDDESDFIGGFPPHPHRGIETFTYILKGGFEHQDHMGHKKSIRAGDVQWMSTGSGVIHSEMPLANEKEGMHGFQIWINMPAKDKMRPAIYQDTASEQMPQLITEQFSFKALAGSWNIESKQLNAPIENLAANAAIADLQIQPHSELSLSVFDTEFAAIYLYSGSLEQGYRQGQMLILDSQTSVKISTANEEAGMLLFKGSPINEEIVHMGPFVMNSQAEIRQAIEDYQSGRFGSI